MADDIPKKGAPGKIARWFAKSKEALTSEEVVERLKKVEYAVESQQIRKPEAEANLALGKAVGEVLTALANTPEAAIQIDTLLIIKAKTPSGESAVFVRTMSQKELAMLEANPGLLSVPADLLRLFAIEHSLEPKKTDYIEGRTFGD